MEVIPSQPKDEKLYWDTIEGELPPKILERVDRELEGG